MWVYGESQVRSQSRHFDGQHPLGNELTRPTASHADAEYAAGGRIKDEFGDTIRAIECRGPARGPPGEAGYLNGAAFLFGLGFRQATPGNLRIGKHDGRNGVRLKSHVVSSNGLHGNATFVRGFMGQHRFAGHVPDGINCRLSGATLRINRNKPALIDLNAGVLETQIA